MFHPDYNYITDELPISLVNRAYQQFLHHSRNPIPPEQLNRKTMNREKLRPKLPECPAALSLSTAYVSNNGTQTDNITCDHELEINDRVKISLYLAKATPVHASSR
ncbi:1376_t:CDS:1 [Rhizophagus irregularis]|uniref:Uncharacterized protein n=1 Tax=Rhizophagus irregularis (strain DAOM 181602 / DAOM 197198 / MUCL 43194) TaxID=747089 RepID=U9TJE3_RHIID|nr:1376_t:CDS:1 [Rhizophagus irregularis]